MRAFRWSSLAKQTALRASTSTSSGLRAAMKTRALATDATAPTATASASATASAASFTPPPFPDHQYDPKAIAAAVSDAEMGKFYLRPRSTTPRLRVFPHILESLNVQNPTPTNPLANPLTLTEALRSSALIYPAWTPKSVRVGAIGQKMGMTAVWDTWGNRLPMTVVRLEENQVLQVKNELSKKGTVGMQIGAGLKAFKNTPKSIIVHCLKAGVMPKKKLAEFGVTTDAVLPLGTSITARHFVPGQYLDVTGTTKGKGTQGGMARWGFHGQPATHGVSITHRSIGSVGSNQSPGRVLKGKKMAGRMGNERRTIENIRLYKIDVKRNLLFIHGSVPGPKLTWLVIRDAKKREFDTKTPPPFPTYFPKAGVAEPEEIVMPTAGLDPNAELAGI